VGDSFSCICLSVCLSVCPRCKRKTPWAVNTKLGTHILYSSCSACIDPEVKRSKVKVTWLRKPSRSCTAAAGVGLHVDTTAMFIANISISVTVRLLQWPSQWKKTNWRYSRVSCFRRGGLIMARMTILLLEPSRPFLAPNASVDR